MYTVKVRLKSRWAWSSSPSLFLIILFLFFILFLLHANSFSTYTVSSAKGSNHDVIVDIFCTDLVELSVAFVSYEINVL